MARGIVQPSAASLREFRAAVLGLKAAPAAIRREVARQTRETLNPIWQGAVAKRAGVTALDAAIFTKGARIKAGNPSQAVAASSRRPVTRHGGGIVPDRDGRAFEFGAVDRNKYTEYRRRGPGASAEVRRRVQRGLPRPSRSGRVVYPAFADMGPRMVSLWVQTIVRVIHDAYEGKR